MKIIKAEDFPIKMTKENIDVLAKMMDSIPPLKEWIEISDLLAYEEEVLIWDRASEIQREKELEEWNSLSSEEQIEEKRKIEESMKDQSTFRGNMGEPENLEEFKRRRGYDPRGSKYDK